MTWFQVVGIISTSALFLPVIFIFALRLSWYKSFPALIAYYTIMFIFNFLSLGIIGADKNFMNYYGILNNFLDAPLMLTFLTYFSKTASFRKKMQLVIPAFVLFEMIVILINGFNIQSAIIALGPGIILVLCFSGLFFIHQAKITIIHQKAAGKALMIAALLFAYCGYSFIYVVYYLIKTPHKVDAFLVYFIINLFSSLLISTGIILERKRVKHLTELLTARKELKVIYDRSETHETISIKRPQWENLL